MRLNAVKMLGISVTISPKDDILEYLEKGLQLSNYPIVKLSNRRIKPIVIVTPNPEQLVLAQKDKQFAEILNQADVAIPDGIGLVWAMRFLSYHVSRITYHETIRRIPGVELMEDLVAMAAKRAYPVALIGGRAGVAVEALECLRRKYPGLTAWSMELPELHLGDLGNLSTLGNLDEKLRKTGTRLIFVGLGAPKQERLMESIKCQVSGVRQEKKIDMTRDTLTRDTPLLLMSVGGAFDIISGRTPRAPSFVRTVGLEWLWRLVREPWRWRRQLALIKFLWLVAKSRLSA